MRYCQPQTNCCQVNTRYKRNIVSQSRNHRKLGSFRPQTKTTNCFASDFRFGSGSNRNHQPILCSKLRLCELSSNLGVLFASIHHHRFNSQSTKSCGRAASFLKPGFDGLRRRKKNEKIDGTAIFAHFKDYYKCSAYIYGLTDDDNKGRKKSKNSERKIGLNNLLGNLSERVYA